MLSKVRLRKQPVVGFILGFALCAPTYAAPSFTPGVDNTIGFHGAANGISAGTAVGSQIYGIVSADSIAWAGATTWNADNTGSSPYDSLTGYFAAKVASKSSLSVGPTTITTINLAPLTASDTATPGMPFTANGKTIFDFFSDTGTAFESNGATADDISKATDGTHWASLGITNGGYWTVTLSGFSASSKGAMNFTDNDTGMSWAKVTGTQTVCSGSGGCDMSFSNTFTARSPENGWSANLNGTIVVQPVPLPAAAWLLFSGLAGLVGVAKREHQAGAA